MGHRVVVWNEHGLEEAGGQQVSGEFCGGRFEYVLGTTQRGRGFGSIATKWSGVRAILARIDAASKAQQLDLLILNQLSFYDTFPLSRLARRSGVPTVQCFEDERFELVASEGLALSQRLFGWNSWLGDHYCSSMADQIWVISSYLQSKYARLSGTPDRVHIIPTLIDVNAWELPSEPFEKIPLILYSGGFGEHEDIEKLTHALGWLKRQGVLFRMLFLGANPGVPRADRMRSMIRELGIESEVEVRGFCPSTVVKSEMARASLLINLRTDSIWSRSGLSTKLSEYLAGGRTIVTTDIGDNARYVEHGVSALVVKPNDSFEQVGEVMATALQDPVLRQRLAVGAKRAALQSFHVPVVQKKLAHLIAQMCPDPSSITG